ncbi:hypothetical protein [Streptomyces sp. SS162]|uniref:hypothetical protein n=1 Tax=Streptomyces sp. SS162 TaxID=3108484 RepID=UPI002F3E5E4B
MKVSSRSEAEKVWHRLRRQSDRVVVLADGLEDALKDAPDRENVIREAIGKAGKDGLPLVVTSRPEKSLESIDAAQTHLGPLSEEAALHYVAEATNWRSDRQRMSWVVEAAEIAESPLYLNIAKDLERRGLLEPVVGGGGEDEYSDPRDHDAWVLRYDMLDAWVQALVDGHLYPEQPLSRAGRRRVVDCLSALACAALRTNSTYVAYDALTRTSRDDEKNRVVDALLGYLAGPSGPSGPAGAGRAARPAGRAVASRADASGQGARTNPAGHIDVRLAGSWGSRLGLVEVQDQGVRFHHSVLQAYLASRCMGALMPVRTAAVSVPRPVGMAAVSRYAGGPVEELLILSSATETEDVTDAYFTPALRRPGRELAMSMVFYSRSRGALEGCHGREADRAASGADCEREHRCPISIVRDLLLDAARQAVDEISRPSDGARRPGSGSDMEQDPKIRALELYSAALDVDSFHHEPLHHSLVEEIESHWESLQTYNDMKLDTPKKALVWRIGVTGRLLAVRRLLPPSAAERVHAETAYDVLFAMARKEPSHGVRFAMAQVIGEGGDEAFDAIKDQLAPARPAPAFTFSAFSAFSAVAGPAGAEAVAVDIEALAYSLGLGRAGDGAASATLPDSDGPPSAPGTTRTERLARKCRAEIIQKRQEDEEAAEREERREAEADWRSEIMKAWVVPMLVQSCTRTPHEDTPYTVLSQWMERHRHDGIGIAQEVAFAQGFRHAANHRTPSTKPARARNVLNTQAAEMLKYTRYWYARLALLHALALWTLPDDVAQKQPRRGRGANPAREIRQWLEQRGEHTRKGRLRDEHPLVRAAARMARYALQTRRPDRFLWIDEAGTAAQIGSETGSLRERRMHDLWIPPSRGWSTLDPAAQQLLADVMVLLTLTEERGDRPQDARRHLEAAYSGWQQGMPPCMTVDRTPLSPRQALVGETPRALPGSDCADGCRFRFCPYPPKGPQCRTELDELFCIHQRQMLDRLQFQAWQACRFRRRAPWQLDTTVANLRTFWNEMAARAGNRALEEAAPPD